MKIYLDGTLTAVQLLAWIEGDTCKGSRVPMNVVRLEMDALDKLVKHLTELRPAAEAAARYFAKEKLLVLRLDKLVSEIDDQISALEVGAVISGKRGR